jgi:hypothetical protein
VLGPGLTIRGGNVSVYVDGSGVPRITGSALAPTMLRDASACVQVDGDLSGPVRGVKIDSGGATASHVTLMDCGQAAVIFQSHAPGSTASIERVTITATTGTAKRNRYGLMMLAGSNTIHGVRITNMGTAGMLLANESDTSVTSSSITACGGDPRGDAGTGGIEVSGQAIATILGTNVSSNSGDGVRCAFGGNVTMRTTAALSNTKNGLFVGPQCRADIAFGLNELNRTSAKNGLSGLCVLGTKFPVVDASRNRWSCDRGDPPGGCAVGAPMSVVDSASCAVGVDYTVATGASVPLIESSCCY